MRAHVTAAQAQEMPVADAGPATREARAYFDLASMFLASPFPRLMAIGGYSGTGKSTIATALVPGVQWLAPSGLPMRVGEWEQADNRCLIAALCAYSVDGSNDRCVLVLHATVTPLNIELPPPSGLPRSK